MKKLVLFTIAFLLIMHLQAQKNNTYNLKINDIVVVKSASLDKTTEARYKVNTVKKTIYALEFNFVVKDADKTWKRIISIKDENGNDIKEQEFENINGKCTIRVAAKTNKPQLAISTYCIPKDPEKAAVIRVMVNTIAKISFI
jgi:phosphopantetheine adenylyltransferase